MIPLVPIAVDPEKDPATAIRAILRYLQDLRTTLNLDLTLASLNSSQVGVAGYFPQTPFTELTLPTDPGTPATPTGLSATGFFRQVGVSWQLTLDPNIAGWELSRADDAAFTVNVVVLTSAFALSFVDGQIPDSTTRYYRLRALGKNGTASGYTAVASATTLGAGATSANVTTALASAVQNLATAFIGNAVIGTANISDASITTAKIANLAITAAKIALATITTAQIAAATITAANIAAATITSAQIANATITTIQIAAATITGANIAAATITDANIQKYILGKNGVAFPGSPSDAEVFYRTDLGIVYRYSVALATWLPLDYVDSGSRLSDSIITAAKIVDATITGAKIASATIIAGNIVDATITGAKIAAATIAAANIIDATITGAKIANATITATQIANATITNAKIASATITGASIAHATIGTLHFANDSISRTGSDLNVSGSFSGTGTGTSTISSFNLTTGDASANVLVFGTIEVASDTVSTSKKLVAKLKADSTTLDTKEGQLSVIFNNDATRGFRTLSLMALVSQASATTTTYALTLTAPGSAGSTMYWQNSKVQAIAVMK